MRLKDLLWPSYKAGDNVIKLPTTYRQPANRQYNYEGLSITPNAGILLRHTETTTTDNALVHDTEIVGPATAQTDKLKELTKWDMDELKQRRLDPDKAAVVKPYWALGQTPAECVAMVRHLPGGSRGLGLRRMQDYFAAFQGALPRQLGEG